MTRADPNYPSSQAIWLREKVPGPLLFISIIALPIILYGGLGGLYDGNYPLAGTVLFGMGLPWLFLYTNGTGLKLAWDEQKLTTLSTRVALGMRPVLPCLTESTR